MQLDAEKLIDTLAEKIGDAAAGAVMVGIHTGGAWVAEKLAAKLGGRYGGALAVTLHRDDFGRRGLHPQKKSTAIDFAVEGSHILLVDDVLQSGRTIRAALNELFDFGRPAGVRLAVLIDRGARALPIHADFAAMTMPLDARQSLVLANENNVLRFEIRDV